MAQSVARQWPGLPDATPESLQLWAKQITRLLQEGAIATGAQVDALDDLFLTPAEGDVAYVNVTGDTMTGQLVVERTATNSSYLIARTNEDGAASGPLFTADRNSASPAANDLIGKYIFRGRDSAANQEDYAYFQGRIDDPTSGSEDSSVLLGRLVAGATVEEVVQTAGKQTIWIPAAAMISRTTNGAAAGTVEMATNRNMFKTLDFDTTTQEFAQFEIFFPKSWNLGTVTFQPVLSHASGSGNVVFGLAGVARSNDDVGDVAFGTAQTSDRTVGTANDIYIGPESASITIAGTPAVDDTVQFQINRTVASDNLGVDARLHGIRLFYTTSAPNDR